MLAFLPDDEIDRLYAAPADLLPRTRNTITTLARLKSELAAIRRRGYAVDQEETTEGIVCIGSPILGADGRPEAAISLAGLSAGMPPATIESLGRTVARTASQVSGARGGSRAIPKVQAAKLRRRKPAINRRRRVRGAA
jgi:IclR family acetate operon transcriptional repressor